ncbi:MAG TPA: class I SAM-dependent methyltransferase [Polyangiaceae bacterium]|jgi:SAM-dependent methyltransferase
MLRASLFSALKATGRVLERGSTLLHYAAAGLLDFEELNEGIREKWSQFGVAESAISQGLFDWEQDLYGRNIRPNERVLLLGCGTGRDLLPLLAAGNAVDGLDIAGLETARTQIAARGLSANLIAGSMEDAPLSEAYDVIVYSWFAYGYLPEAARRVRTLARFKRHLRPGGRVIVSLPPVGRQPNPLYVAAARVASRLARADWRPEPGDSLFVSSRETAFPEYHHVFAPGEPEREFERGGLRLVERSAPEGIRAFVLVA